MGKVNLYVKRCLGNEKLEYNIKGILENKKIKFLDNDKIMIINLKEKTLERYNQKEKYFFDFQKEICLIKNNDIEITVPIKVVKCTIQDNNFYIKYQIDEYCNEFEIKQMEEL